MMPEKNVDEMTLTEVRALVNTLEVRNQELIGLVGDQLEDADMLREAGEFGTAQLALEDIGWRPLMGISEGANQFTLDGLHRASELCRAVATINPLVKRGLNVRAGYIWGSGVNVVPTEFISSGPGRPRTVNTTPTMPDGLNDVLTGALAQMELEKSASTDGNLFFLVDKREKTVQRVPFEEITDGVSQRGNRERLLYIQRTWNDWDLEAGLSQDIETRPLTNPDPSRHGRPWIRTDLNQSPDVTPSYNYRTVWYPTPAALTGNRRSGKIASYPIDNSKVMVHAAFNKLTGWRWGVPDVLAAVWWTKAYKEFIENCATLTKAYARFAWKVTNDKSKAVRRTAAQIAAAPRVDPATGQALSVGASAVLGSGQDLSAVGGNTKVDFDAGRPLAAMIAAALDVPLPSLTQDPSIGNRAASETLDKSTTLAMQNRQKVMDEVFQTIFNILGMKVRLRWPEISEEPIHRRLQALNMAIRLGLLSDKEARAMLLDAWHDKWDDFPSDPPTVNQLPVIMRPGFNVASRASATVGPGASGPLKSGSADGTSSPKQPDPISMGDHELRDEGGE